MTVETNNITSGPYQGNDIADTFSYDFRIEDKTQIIVYETDDLGVETVLTVDTDYTVAGIGNDVGGTITRVTGALPTGYTWYMRSDYESTQSTDFDSQGGFFPDVHEAAFDKLTFLIQQINDQISRSFKLSDGYSGDASAELPNPVALKFLRWNSDANALELVDGTTSANASDVVFTPFGDISATDVQAAINELDTEKQPIDAGLTSISGLTTTANKMIYTTAADTYAVTDLSVFGRSLIDDADASAARTTLGVVIGTDVQAYDADIPTVSANQAEMEAGTEADLRSMSPLRVAQAIAAQATPVNVFESAEQTITSAGSLTIAHGLAATPRRVTAYLVCKIAQHNYSVGDRLIISAGHQSSATNNGYGVSIVPDSTNLNIRFGSDTFVFLINNKTTGGLQLITLANWRIVFVADEG